MGQYDELQDAPPDLPTCCRCGRSCEPIELQTCPACRKVFCVFCVFRMGGAEYCSRPCGERLFFGEMDDDGGFEDTEE